MFQGVSDDKKKIPFPKGFEPDKKQHLAALERSISEKYGEGYEIYAIDDKSKFIYIYRQAAVTSVTATSTESYDVRLAKGTKPSDGDKVAAQLADQHEGFLMTSFSPFLGKATITRMDEETARCRAAVAGVLGVKAWDVQCEPRSDGGFNLGLPNKYVPSKHDEKLLEVATSVVGRDGWFVDVNAKTLTGAIIPGNPPTFPAVIKFPFDKLHGADPSRLLIGKALAPRADQKNEDAFIDFAASPHAQLSGTTGSGKTVTLSGMITYALATGHSLGLVNLPYKAVDFSFFQKFVEPGYWGCAAPTSTVDEWLPEALTTLGLIYDEGMRRAGILADYGVAKVEDLPKSAAVKPILLVCDEVTGILQLDDVPKGLPKDNPMVVDANYKNLMRQMILNYMKRIAAELRFAGIHMIMSTQVASVNTGIPTSLRTNLQHKLLLGPNPKESNRKLALSDPDSVPEVPDNIKADAKASKGVGVAELEGSPNIVFKSFYASNDEMVAFLDKIGVPSRASVRPTTNQINRYTPALGDDEEPSSRAGREPQKMRNTGTGAEWMTDPETGEKLTGFAKANAARHAGALRG